MIIDIHAQGFTVTRALADRATDRLGREVAGNPGRMHAARGAAPSGTRPARHRQEIPEFTRAHGGIA